MLFFEKITALIIIAHNCITLPDDNPNKTFKGGSVK